MNSSNRSIWLPGIFVLGLAVTMLAMFGCQGILSGPETPTAQENPAANQTDTTVSTKNIVPTIVPVSTVTTPESGPALITIWMAEPISPKADGAAGEFISNVLVEFEQANPGLSVKWQLKKPAGKGGVVDFLRTATAAAPTVLPDVVIMQATDLNQASLDKLIQPLDGKLDRVIVQDLLPAARRVGTVNERLMGVPLGLEMEHVVYNTRVFTGTPIMWTDIFSKNSHYLFPAKGVNGLVNDASLSQYFSAGGELVDERGAPKINEQALLTVLTTYENALNAGLIDQTLLEADSTEDLWPIYLQGQVGLTQISVKQYLTDREQLHSSAVSGVPLYKSVDKSVGVMHAWVMALTTTDPTRQENAVKLIETFLSTTNNANWNEINKSIPVRDTSYQLLAGDDEYWVFLTDMLNSARPEPRFAGYDQVGRILQQSIEQVIRGEATAAEAATAAVDVLTQ
jgi:ABC-type glycerol-3-phosphate transport system substrate-binding protein